MGNINTSGGFTKKNDSVAFKYELMPDGTLFPDKQTAHDTWPAAYRSLGDMRRIANNKSPYGFDMYMYTGLNASENAEINRLQKVILSLDEDLFSEAGDVVGTNDANQIRFDLSNAAKSNLVTQAQLTAALAAISTGFNPATQPGLLAYFKHGVGQSNNNGSLAWTSIVGNYVANAFGSPTTNGQGGVVFDGGGYLSIPNFDLSQYQDLLIYMVLKTPVNRPDTQSIIELSDDFSTGNRFIIATEGGTSELFFRSKQPGVEISPNAAFNPYPDNQLFLARFEAYRSKNANENAIAVNGVLGSSNIVSQDLTDNYESNTLYIGGRPSILHFSGEIRDIIILAGVVHDATAVTNFQNYLKTANGL